MYHVYYRTNRVQPSVVAYAKGDVNGDGVPDYVYLTGIKSPNHPFIQNIKLIVQDGRTGKAITVPLQENAGYDPSIFLGDFTGDGVANVLISINSGGSGAIMYHYIYSFLNNTPQILFDFHDYNEHYQYQVTYKDNYKVEAISKSNNKKYMIDLSLRSSDYLEEIYDEGGKLKDPIQGFVNPLSGLYPVDFDSNNVYELFAYQKIAGRYNADALGYFLNTLGWQGNRFILQNQNVAIWGSERI